MRRLTLSNSITFLALLGYCFAFAQSMPHWFHPGWTTDDALQQVFPFHAVYHPEVFRGDLIAETMAGYLAPIHYWLSYFMTWIHGEPIIASHYVMLIQYLLTMVFLFLAIRKVSATPAAFVAVLWLLHTRELMQRMTGGIPRGWAPVVFAGYLYTVLSGNHKAVLALLFFGCLSHPPATMICALAYGLYLLIGYLRKATRVEFAKPLFLLLLLSPIYIVVTYKIVERSDEVGQMVGPSEASEMPQLQRPYGRFPFLPVLPVVKEVRMFGFQPFVGRLYNPGKTLKPIIRIGVLVGIVMILLYGIYRRRRAVPLPLLLFMLSAMSVYLLSRELVFKLYVPDRHILFPFAFFLISFFVVGLWRAFHRSTDGDFSDTSFQKAWPSLLALLLLLGVVGVGTGTGLYGDGNFNYSSTKKGGVFHWIRDNTPEDALIAGHPVFIDGVPLFSARKAYATTETYHPFYKGYLEQIEPRILLSFQAHFARDLKELVSILEPVGIDYFVFERRRFYPEALKKETYYEPLRPRVKELAARDYTEYAYRELPNEESGEASSFIAFRDAKSVVVDVAKLRMYLEEKERGA